MNTTCMPKANGPTEKIMNDSVKPEIAVIGGGPAGMTAAVAAASGGASVTLYEPNRMLGRKLRITGKGRCNVTNNCTPEEFLKNVTRGRKFMYGPIYKFTPEDTMTMFTDMGVELKTERGRRVFPVSDNADDIADALSEKVCKCGVAVVHSAVRELTFKDSHVTGVKTDSGEKTFDAVVVATGGMSYPATGSRGDGYRFAHAAGISVTPLKPSLVPIVTREDTSCLMGLALKNVTLGVTDKNGKKVFSELGELLFTHFGLSGPLVLSASAHMQDEPVGEYRMSIDMKPGLDEAALDKRLISDLAKYSAKDFVNSLGDLLPSKMIPYMVAKTKIPAHKRSGEITKEERRVLLECLKHLTFTPKSFRGIEEAIITCGGVDTAELDPRTMMSRKVAGLFFAGEVIDADAYTGGYNLQIAYSTGVLAGKSAASYGFAVKEERS